MLVILTKLVESFQRLTNHSTLPGLIHHRPSSDMHLSRTQLRTILLQNKLFESAFANATVLREVISQKDSNNLQSRTQNAMKYRKELNVVAKKDCDGKIVYLSARPAHCSHDPDSSIWKVLLPEDIQVLEKELRRCLKPRYHLVPQNTDCLRVAMVCGLV